MRITYLRVFSGISHLIYGSLTVFHPFYISEFTRYGFSELRNLIGVVQLLCGAALIYHIKQYHISLFSALALSVLMGGALITRIILEDSVVQSLPAALYFTLNSYIFIYSLKQKL